MKLIFTLLLLLFLPFSASAQPSDSSAWKVDRTKSILQFRGFKDGKPFTTIFQSWGAEINFDPANPKTSSAIITVDTRSGSTGKKTFREYLVAPAWYVPEKMSRAQFHAFSFNPMGNNFYQANGVLRVYNQPQTIVLPFPGISIPVQVSIQGNQAEFKSDFSFSIPDLSPGASKQAFKKVNFNMILNAYKDPIIYSGK